MTGERTQPEPGLPTARPAGVGRGRRIAVTSAIRRLEAVAVSPWFAYGSILLIQAKVIWGIWLHRDITAGDTSFYFASGAQWAEDLVTNPLWSPAYQVFYGSLQWLIPSAYEVTIVHRILIVLAVSLLVLAVMRRLLTPGVAWVVAAWWAVLPVNYDVTYEVHLFALIPGLVAALLALSMKGLPMRAAVLGVLLGATILVRNEYLIPTVLWLLGWAGYELWRRRRDPAAAPSLRRLARVVAVPVAVVVLLFGFTVLRNTSRDVSGQAEAKQGLLTCQMYLPGYLQRNRQEVDLDRTDCGQLAKRQFGEEQPSLMEAIRANPGAMAEHFWWNAQLTPYGLQHVLFDRISGPRDRNPDFVPIVTGSDLALLGSVLLVALLLAGAMLFRQADGEWRRSLRERAWGWLALGALALTALVVGVLIRPRAEYLFGLSVFVLAAAGASMVLVGSRWPSLRRLLALVPIAAVALVVALPSRFDEDYRTIQTERGRPLLEMISRLEPYEDLLSRGNGFLAAQFEGEACRYVGRAAPCQPVSMESAAEDRPPGTPAHRWLDRRGIDVIYADYVAFTTPAYRLLFSGVERHGWERVASGPDDEWILLRRTEPAGAGR